MSDLSRRAFLAGLGALGVSSAVAGRGARAADRIRVGYAAITWGGRDEQAIEDIAAAGYHAIQLRGTAVDRFGANPGALRDLLSRHGLKMAVLSSGNLSIDPAAERDQLALHTGHARFVKSV